MYSPDTRKNELLILLLAFGNVFVDGWINNVELELDCLEELLICLGGKNRRNEYFLKKTLSHSCLHLPESR